MLTVLSMSFSGLRVLILATGWHLLRIILSWRWCPQGALSMQSWGSSCLVCRGLMSWHFCGSTLRISVTLSAGWQRRQEVGRVREDKT